VIGLVALLVWWGEAPERPKMVRKETNLLPTHDAAMPNRVPSRSPALGHGSAHFSY